MGPRWDVCGVRERGSRGEATAASETSGPCADCQIPHLKPQALRGEKMNFGVPVALLPARMKGARLELKQEGVTAGDSADQGRRKPFHVHSPAPACREPLLETLWAALASVLGVGSSSSTYRARALPTGLSLWPLGCSGAISGSVLRTDPGVLGWGGGPCGSGYMNHRGCKQLHAWQVPDPCAVPRASGPCPPAGSVSVMAPTQQCWRCPPSWIWCRGQGFLEGDLQKAYGVLGGEGQPEGGGPGRPRLASPDEDFTT